MGIVEGMQMVRRILMRVGLAGVVAGIWLAGPCRIVVVQGRSMEPTMHNGQVIMVDRSYYRRHSPQAGDIVVFRHGGRTYIKRVYAGEGETVYWLAEGRTGLDTLIQPIRRDCADRVATALVKNRQIRVKPLRIPMGTFFALGDHFGQSIDSRELGPIQNDAVIGRVLPWHGMTPAPDFELAPPNPRATHEHHAPAAGAHSPRETVLL
jgi:signal peptidase I